jgi:anti-anti-sigma factor
MDPEVLRVDLRTFEGGVVLSLQGELDGENVLQLTQKVDVLVAAAPSVVVVDLQDLRFVDAKGLRALLECDKVLRRLCEAVLVQGVRPNVRRAMDIVGVSRELRLEGAS